MKYDAEFRRCLIELDVATMRRLWEHVSPNMAQPNTDDECLETMHRARVQMATLPEKTRAYSERWLEDRTVNRDVFAVGISVKAASSPNPYNRRRGIYIQHEMSYAAEQAIRSGMGLENLEDAAEVKRRIMLAREKAWK